MGSGIVSVALSALLLAPRASAPPALPTGPIQCVMTSQASCSDPESICIGGPVRGGVRITFDFRRQRFQSIWGSGRITQFSRQPDGWLSAILASPPVSGEFRFAPDFRSGAQGDGRSGWHYRCSSVRG